MDEKTEEKTLTPSEYFDIIKNKRHTLTYDKIETAYINSLYLMHKYEKSGKIEAGRKLYNWICGCEKEIAALKSGIDTYIDRHDLDEYISKIADKSVCIIEIENFSRDIPDEVVDKLVSLKEKEIFDEYFVVFTDYTGKERKKIKKERREKDPILLGAIKIGNQLNSRLYYIDSWVDEYCDLTLDKLVQEFKASDKYGGFDPRKSIRETYKDEESFMKAFKGYQYAK